MNQVVDTHTGQMAQNQRYLYVPASQEHDLGRVGGVKEDNSGVIITMQEQEFKLKCEIRRNGPPTHIPEVENTAAV